MSDTAIKVENLSKRYRIGLEEELPDTLVGAVTQAIKRPLRNWRQLRRLTNFEKASERSNVQTLQRSNHLEDDVLWALKDVSFEVKRGEVVGIIGRNGAGKSTLLKILARITHPTRGRAVINGRVGSLLEVGTGFHPDLTGRENIYLNGTILGMTKDEVDRKFDEIVDFSGVEKFIDTPVKRYSSGMRVRLAFSVAAHLDPEILLVDEVLAVGDAAFQKKCLGKMGDVASEGRTVLFVSHNMSTVQVLCTRAVLLEEGRIAAKGQTFDVVEKYQKSDAQKGEATFGRTEEEHKIASYSSARLLDDQGQVMDSFQMGDDIVVELVFEATTTLQNPGFGIVVTSAIGQPLLRLISRETYGQMPPTRRGGIVRLRVEKLNLLPGTYFMTLGLSDGGCQIDLIKDAIQFEIKPHAVYPTGKLPSRASGIIYTLCDWSHNYE
jgi:lipopolysaccharide transport system ATP-binding protein